MLDSSIYLLNFIFSGAAKAGAAFDRVAVFRICFRSERTVRCAGKEGNAPAGDRFVPC
jgi:hypothetical protein